MLGSTLIMGSVDLGGASNPIPRGLGIFLGNSPGTDTPLFTTFLGRAPRIQLVFFDSSSKAAFSAGISFECTTFTGITACWSVPLCAGTDTLTNANAGDYDAIWTSCAQGILAAAPAGEAILVRIGWEPNIGTWPWSAVTLGGAAYNSAFQRCVGKFRAVSSRFKFVWCMTTGQSFDVTTCYPGDTFVDAVAPDLYNTSSDTTSNAGLDVFNFYLGDTFGLTFHKNFAASHSKIFGLTEIGVNQNTFTAFASALFQFIVTNVLPTKGFHHYWNSDSGGIPCKISTGERAAIASLYQQYFGPPVIATGDGSFLQNTPGSITLTSNQDSIYTMTWSISGADAASFSLVGNVLSWGSIAAGTKSPVIRATNSDPIQPQHTDKTINFTFVVPYVFTNTEAAAYVARCTNTVTEANKANLDNFWTAIKSGPISGTNLLAKADTFGFGFLDSQAATLNAKSAAYGTIIPKNSPAYVANEGYQGNFGTTAYLDMGITFDRSGNVYTNNSAMLAAWDFANISTGSGILGNDNIGVKIIPRNGTTTSGILNGFGTGPSATIATGAGFTAVNRTSGTAEQLYRNGVSVGTTTTGDASGGVGTGQELLGMGTNTSFPDAHIMGAWWMGSSGSVNEHKDVYNAFRNLMVAYGVISGASFPVAT